MITVTPDAAKQIVSAAEQGGSQGMALRLAARPTAEGGLEYGMGFDEVREEDLTFTSEGIELVLEPQYGPLLKGTVIDFVELEPGQFHFIFMNPNDTNCTPPGENQGGGCGCGSGGCSSSS